MTRSPDRQPTDQPPDQPAYRDSTEAAQTLGISLDALRKRIARGTIKAIKENGHWYIQTPDNQPANGRPDDRPDNRGIDSKDLTITVMEARIASLERQLETREREVGELHQLMAQTALNQAQRRPWWRFW